MRIKHTLKILTLLFLALLYLPVEVLAYQGSGWVNEDPTTWYQRETPGAELPLGAYANGYTLGAHGCTIHSASAMYIKYGARKRGYIPKDFREESLKLNNEGGQGGISNDGLLMWGGVSTMSNGFFEQPTRFNNPSKEQVQSWMKENKGVIAEVKSKDPNSGGGTHFVFLDSMNGDDVNIVDSGWQNTKLSDWTLGYKTISTAWVYTPLKNKDAPSLYKNKDGSQTGTKKGENGNVDGSSKILSEDELEGLANLPRGIEDKQDTSVQVFIDFPKRDKEAREKAVAIQKSVKRSEEAKNARIVRSVISLTGWVLVLAGITRLVVFTIDAKMGTNIYSKLNAGRKRAVDVGFKESKGLKKDKTVTWREGIINNVVLIALGFLILSGVLYSLFLKFLV